MASATMVSADASFPLIRLPRIRRIPFLSQGVFVVCDAAALIVSGMLTLLSKRPGDGGLGIERFVALWPLLGMFFIIFGALHLYPGIVYNAVTELRRLGLALSMSFLVIEGVILVNRDYPRRLIVLWWLAAMLAVPMLRAGLRHLVCHRSWWGIPVAVFHTGPESLELVRELEKHPEIGLRPVVLLAWPRAARPRHSLPVLDLRCSAGVRACGVQRAMIALPDTGCGKLLAELETFESIFPRLMILQGSAALYSLTVDARQIGRSLAVEVRRDLLLPLPRIAKRTIDLVIVGFGLPMVALLILLLGLLVRLESPGPVFFGHRRVGRGHSTFLTWKIRTMQVNADAVLQAALVKDSALRAEWERDRKLRHDPRITRVGRFLRRTSLDELPQFWNVLRGEMSLVGPRPIVEEEVAGYGQNFALYCRVTPGLTGLWQVSGRSAVGTSDRVRLDSYYVRNWSPWLDLHILARTAKVVLTGQGAY